MSKSSLTVSEISRPIRSLPWRAPKTPKGALYGFRILTSTPNTIRSILLLPSIVRRSSIARKITHVLLSHRRELQSTIWRKTTRPFDS